MLKKILIAGSAAAVVLGAGTAALAESGPASPSGAPSASTSSAAAAPAHPKRAALRRALHAQWVTRDGKGSTTFVTHDAIRGQVTAATPTSITVQAADHTTETYGVTGTTKIHSRADVKGVAGSMGEVHKGDTVRVIGTGSTTLTATRIVDVTK
jgi:hypothetical protein